MDAASMDLNGKPPTSDTAKPAPYPNTITTGADLIRRRRARNWALLAVLLGLSVLFYAITLVKMAKGG
jgi:hypothetical protein